MKNNLKTLALGAMLTHAASLFAQDWHANFPSGNPINSTEWLGCDGTSTQPLRIKTVPDYAIDLYTSDSRRHTLLPDNTYVTLGGYSSIVANGFSLHSPDVDAFYAGGAPGPFTLQHMAAATNSTYEVAYRDWARTGTTYTGGGTMGYFGLKEDGKSNTDLIVQLARREGTTAPDRIRFLFTGALTGASTGAASQEGLEGMRLTAVANDKVNVGIGDFFAAGVGEPAERLDVVDGKVRIRQLPSDAVSTSDEVVTVNMTTGVLEHRPVPSGCIWGDFPSLQHIRSGLGNPGTGGTNCPDRGWLYTIGDPGTLNAKMSLFQNSNERNVQSGLNVSMVTNPANVTESYGIRCDVQPLTNESSNASHGVWSRLANPKGSYGNGVFGTATKSNTASITDMSGVRGLAQVSSTGSATTVHGLYGETILQGPASSAIGATGRANISFTSSTIPESVGIRGQSWSYGSTVTNAYGGRFTSGILYNGTVTNGYGVYGLSNNGIGTLTNSYGVYGIASGGTFNAAIYGDLADTTGAKWAGYFKGKVRVDYNAYVNGNVLVTSDASLKTNVQDIANASELVEALQPKTYDFIPQQHPHMIMPQGRQWGLLAQDLQEVIPDLVERVAIPAEYDSTGVLVADETSHLAVNYIGLIPVLIAAMQEQNARIDHLEQALAACCANPDGSRQQAPGLDQPSELDGSFNGNEKLRIQPNPFNERTTVFYTLDRGGRTQLLANSSDGRDLRVLQEASLEAGSYQFDWNTAELAPGMYYVTLLLDGQPVVKKAVKVDR